MRRIGPEVIASLLALNVMPLQHLPLLTPPLKFGVCFWVWSFGVWKKTKPLTSYQGANMTLFDHSPTISTDSYRRKRLVQLVRVKNLELQDL